MKKRRYGLLLLPVLLILMGGWSACSSYPCKDPAIGLHFRRFDSAQLDQVIVRRFEKGTRFTELDTEITYRLRLMMPGKDPEYWVAPFGMIGDKYDFEFYVVATGKTYRLADIHYEAEKQSVGIGGVQETCSNSVVYSLNGVAGAVRGAVQSGDNPGDAIITIYP